PSPAFLLQLSLQRPYPPPLPITVDDYEIVYADGQESPQGDAATVEFEKEDLNTTVERNLLS
nr:hypothetical protein [Tanacetum cinerariifolium]